MDEQKQIKVDKTTNSVELTLKPYCRDVKHSHIHLLNKVAKNGIIQITKWRESISKTNNLLKISNTFANPRAKRTLHNLALL